MYDIFFSKIMYKIIIFMGNSALIDFSLIIMSWKQFMKNNTIFLYSRIYTGSSFLQMTVFLPFRSEGSVNNTIKALSNLGTNTEILLLLKVQILQHSNLGIFEHQWCIYLNYWIELLKFKRGKKILSFFFELKKNRVGVGLYIKCNYYHISLVQTLKGNQKLFCVRIWCVFQAVSLNRSISFCGIGISISLWPEHFYDKNKNSFHNFSLFTWCFISELMRFDLRFN